MAAHNVVLLVVLVLASASNLGSASRELSQPAKVEEGATYSMKYHNGVLLNGKISVHLIWYGNFKPSQRGIIVDFINSLYGTVDGEPTVAKWWKGTETFYSKIRSRRSSPLVLSLRSQISDDTYSLGKRLTNQQIIQLASRGGERDAINIVLTSNDVVVDGFCSTRCGTHGSTVSSRKTSKFAYIWVGNCETLCPGHCAWPFHRPMYGPQVQQVVAPNNDVGVDGMIINLASLLSGTVTNPFGNGYFQGPKEAPMEAASACSGIFGSGAYPGYVGNLLEDSTTGASYNARGINGRKYLLPALMDPTTAICSTLV